jgi:hypothetical protein
MENSKFDSGKTQLPIQSKLALLEEGNRFDAILRDKSEVSGIFVSSDAGMVKYKVVGTDDEAQISKDSIDELFVATIKEREWR